jgi:hypothetical protein
MCRHPVKFALCPTVLCPCHAQAKNGDKQFKCLFIMLMDQICCPISISMINIQNTKLETHGC